MLWSSTDVIDTQGRYLLVEDELKKPIFSSKEEEKNAMAAIGSALIPLAMAEDILDHKQRSSVLDLTISADILTTHLPFAALIVGDSECQVRMVEVCEIVQVPPIQMWHALVAEPITLEPVDQVLACLQDPGMDLPFARRHIFSEQWPSLADVTMLAGDLGREILVLLVRPLKLWTRLPGCFSIPATVLVGT